MSSWKMDEELIERYIKQAMQAALGPKLLAIAAEKTALDPTDVIVLPVFQATDWISDFTHGYNNRSSFISYGVETSEPLGESQPGPAARKVTLSAVAFVNKRNNDGTARRVSWRLSRGFREVLQEMSFSPQLRGMSPLVISAISPEEIQLGQNASSVYLAAGVRFYTTIY